MKKPNVSNHIECNIYFITTSMFIQWIIPVIEHFHEMQDKINLEIHFNTFDDMDDDDIWKLWINSILCIVNKNRSNLLTIEPITSCDIKKIIYWEWYWLNI